MKNEQMYNMNISTNPKDSSNVPVVHIRSKILRSKDVVNANDLNDASKDQTSALK